MWNDITQTQHIRTFFAQKHIFSSKNLRICIFCSTFAADFEKTRILSALERWQSGRLRRSWKPLSWEAPGVRIPLSPPEIRRNPQGTPSCFFRKDWGSSYSATSALANPSKIPLKKANITKQPLFFSKKTATLAAKNKKQGNYLHICNNYRIFARF